MVTDVRHVFAIVIAGAFIYFLWMDLTLYYKLHTDTEALLVTEMYEKAANSTIREAKPHQSGIAFFDPFRPISVKLIMLDHLNHYIYYSVCWWLDTNMLHISDKLLFITPDMISLSHVAIAALGARSILSDSIWQRRLGVLLFELRSMLDSYDGMVARARRNEHGLRQVWSGWGFWMDGVCDATGTVLFFLAAYYLLKRRPYFPSTPLTSSVSSDGISSMVIDESEVELLIRNHSSKGNVFARFASKLPKSSDLTILALLTQQFFCSFFWNRYMEGFHLTLEIPKLDIPGAMNTQIGYLRSAGFWMIAWFWKLMNPHSQLSLLLAFIFFDVVGLAFNRIRFLGFVPLAVLVVVSEVFLHAISIA